MKPWPDAGQIALIREVFPKGQPERPWFVAIAVDNHGSHEWRSLDPMSSRYVRENPPQPLRGGYGFERLPFPTQAPDRRMFGAGQPEVEPDLQEQSNGLQ